MLRDVSGNVSTFNRHYAHLLLAELLYKNDYAQANHLELLEAVSYFDSLVADTRGGADTRRVSIQWPRRRDAWRASAKNTAFLDARAHYINGVGYYEQGSVVPACKEYLKAVEVMEEHFEEEELAGKKAKFMALTYSHLTSLFSDMYLHEQAIYFGKFSLHYFNKHEAPPQHIAWALDEIGLHFDILENYDSAYYFYNQELKVLSDTNSLAYRDVSAHLASLLYKTGGHATAFLNQLNVLLSNANSGKEYYSRCLSIGEIYYTEKQFDSAWNYFDKVYNGTQSVESKKLAAERLIEICKAQGKEFEAMEYADFLVPFANLEEEKQSAIKSQLTEQYKNYGQWRQERVNQQEKMRNLRRTMIIVGGLLVLMLFITILYHKNKKRKQHLETQIEADHYAFEMQQKALSSKLKKSNEALHDALKQIENNLVDIDPQSKPEHTKDYLSFVEVPICRHIFDTVHQQNFKSKMDYLVYKEHALQKEQLLALRVEADKYMDDFTVRLRKRFLNLTDEDVTYCCLYLLDITDADIAALMQKAYPTVCERRRKIKRIVGEENNLNFALRNL